jgi:uncharacterized protein with PQ loop repeat
MFDTLGIADVAGFLAFLVTVAYTCLGLPSQIRKNHASGSAAGLSLVSTILMLCTFSSWLVYGLVKTQRDWYLVGSNLPGTLCALIILLQCLVQRRLKGDKPS